MKNIILLVGAFFVMCTLSAQVQIEAFNSNGQIANWESDGSFVWHRFANSTGYSGYIQAASSTFDFGSTSKDLKFQTTQGSSVWTNSNGGRFGIDNTSPLTKLHVTAIGTDGILIDGNDTGDTRLQIENGGGNHFIFDDDSDGHNLKVESANHIAFNAGGATERMIIESTGEVGINTANPAAELHVTGDARFVNGVIELFQGGEAFNIDLRANGQVAFEANGSIGNNSFVIDDDSGFVGIGTDMADEQLHVVGNMRMEGDLFLGSVETLTDGGATTIATNSDFDPAGSLTQDMGATTLAWDEIYADNFNNVSDMRAKTNVIDLPYGLNQILNLETIKYTLISDPHQEPKLGLSAQNLLVEIPEVVQTHNHKYNDDGTVTYEEMPLYGVTYNELIPVLVKSIQEQNQLIEALEARIEQLETEK